MNSGNNLGNWLVSSAARGTYNSITCSLTANCIVPPICGSLGQNRVHGWLVLGLPPGFLPPPMTFKTSAPPNISNLPTTCLASHWLVKRTQKQVAGSCPGLKEQSQVRRLLLIFSVNGLSKLQSTKWTRARVLLFCFIRNSLTFLWYSGRASDQRLSLTSAGLRTNMTFSISIFPHSLLKRSIDAYLWNSVRWLHCWHNKTDSHFALLWTQIKHLNSEDFKNLIVAVLDFLFSWLWLCSDFIVKYDHRRFLSPWLQLVFKAFMLCALNTVDQITDCSAVQHLYLPVTTDFFFRFSDQHVRSDVTEEFRSLILIS